MDRAEAMIDARHHVVRSPYVAVLWWCSENPSITFYTPTCLGENSENPSKAAARKRLSGKYFSRIEIRYPDWHWIHLYCAQRTYVDRTMGPTQYTHTHIPYYITGNPFAIARCFPPLCWATFPRYTWMRVWHSRAVYAGCTARNHSIQGLHWFWIMRRI